MTLTLEISPELEEALRDTAAREGVAPDRYILDLIEERLGRNRSMSPRLTRTEAELLQKINEGLPEATWERYHDLKAKRDAETLTAGEHAELIALVNEVEMWNIRRLEVVAELARLRGLPFEELVQQLGIGPRSDA